MITTLTGENEVAWQAELRRIVDAFLSEYGDMGLERLDGEEASYNRMHEAVQSLPFLAPKKLIILRSPGANKEFAEKFEQLLQDVPEANDVVLVEPKLDKRTGYYKQLQKLTEFKAFNVLDVNGLARYAVDYVKAQQGTLSPADARMLIDRIGTSQLRLTSELDKLLVQDLKITRQAIEALTERTPQSSIFELLDAAFSGNGKRAMQLYDEQRELQVEPQQIQALVIWQLHQLALIMAGGNRSSAEIAKSAGLRPFAVEKAQRLARRISYQKLKTLIADMRDFDVRLKSESIDADQVMRYYLLNLAK